MRRSKPRIRRGLLVIATVLALALTACSTDDVVSSGDRLEIVVTTSVWADVVDNVVGDDASVETIIPVGADPHDFAPSSQQVASIQTADLVIANGLGLEEMLEDVITAAASDGVRVLEIGPGVNPIPFALDDDAHDDDADHAHDGDDPHVWMDPDRVAAAAILIGETLSELDESPDWVARAQNYAAQVAEAGEVASATLEAVPTDQRKLVTNHEALGYFADRFGFKVVGVVFPGGSTLSDPSSAELAELVELMEAEGVRTIFGESSSPSDLTDAVAAEVGDDVEVVELFTGTLGDPGSGADTVIGMIATNAERVAAALSR